ncbi:MAG TPA: hypothetical protein VK009_11800 [Chloroflexota bacterium]|nr:hypothetical protein [Chloroflexota bacterium]
MQTSMLHNIVLTVIGVAIVLVDGFALRSHRRAVDCFPVLAHLHHNGGTVIDCRVVLLRQARFAARSVAGRQAVLLCMLSMAAAFHWLGWNWPVLYVGVVLFAGLQTFSMVQVADLAREARSLAFSLAQARRRS